MWAAANVLVLFVERLTIRGVGVPFLEWSREWAGAAGMHSKCAAADQVNYR